MDHLDPILDVVGTGLGLVIAFIGLEAWMAWREVQETTKEEFFTCDKHGVFPMKATIEAPMPWGGDPQRVCPFCFDAAFKKADQLLLDEEARRGGIKPV